MRYGLRNLRRNPGFALVVIATMALGIGANTAIFSVVNGVLLRPLPYEGGDRLVVLRQQRPLAGDTDISFSPKEIADYGTQTAGLEGVAEFHSMWFILLGRSEPERVSTGVVSANFFPLLGVKPMLGRVVHSRGRAGRLAGSADPQPQVLAAQLRRRPVDRRAGLPDERPAARSGRRPAGQSPNIPKKSTFTCRPRPVHSDRPSAWSKPAACAWCSAFGKIRKGVTLDKARADIAVVAVAPRKGLSGRLSVDSGLSDRRHPAAGGAHAFVQDDAARAARHSRRSSC